MFPPLKVGVIAAAMLLLDRTSQRLPNPGRFGSSRRTARKRRQPRRPKCEHDARPGTGHADQERVEGRVGEAVEKVDDAVSIGGTLSGWLTSQAITPHSTQITSGGGQATFAGKMLEAIEAASTRSASAGGDDRSSLRLVEIEAAGPIRSESPTRRRGSPRVAPPALAGAALGPGIDRFG